MTTLLAATRMDLGSDDITDLGATNPPDEAERVRLQALINCDAAGPVGGIADALDRLCRCAAEELGLAGAAVTLVPTTGAHAVSAASDTATRQHEEEQFRGGEGPTQGVCRSQRFGTITSRFEPDEVRVVQALPNVATIAILQEPDVTHAESLTEQLQGALNSRIVIERAKGALARSKGISVGAAFDTLRLEARSSSQRLVEVAQAVLDDLEKDSTE